MLNEALGDYSPEEERAKKFFHAVILDLNKPCSKAETAQRVRAIASLSSLLFSMGFVERSALALEVIETQAAHAALELAMLIRKLKIPSATVANGIPFVLQGGVITSEHGPKYLNCIAQRLALELKVPKVVFEPIYIKEKESGCVIAAFVDGMRRGLAKKTAPASASSQTFAGGRKQEDSGGGAPADAGPVEGAPTQKVTH
jgi:hypothetical protein